MYFGVSCIGSGIFWLSCTHTAMENMFGGTLGYAGIDPEFRNYVEGLIPGAKDVFQAVLGSAGINEG